ncbi:hypothetical protein P2318_31060 [Myxococcaceae bacterium GXIMD 01537]
MRARTRGASSGGARRVLRGLGWVLALAVGLEVLLNLLLNLGVVPALIQRSTPRTRLTWRRVWWPWPGRVRVTGFSLAQRDRAVLWNIEAEQVEADLSLAGLFQHRVEAQDVRVRGAEVRVRPMPPLSIPPAKPTPKPLQVLLTDITVFEGRGLSWGAMRFQGPGEAQGTLRLVAGQKLAVTDARVRLSPGSVYIEDRPAARLEQLTADFSIDAARKPEGGLDVFAALSGTLQVRGRLSSLGWVERLLPQPSPVAIDGGEGQVEADVRVERGLLLPGSKGEARGESLGVRYGAMHLRAPWRAVASVREPDREGIASLGELRLIFEPVRTEGGKVPALETPEVTFDFDVEPRMGGARHDAWRSVHVARSAPVDLRLLNPRLGPTFQVQTGSVTVAASASRTPRPGSGRGHIDLESDLLSVLWGQARLLGRASARIDAHRLVVERERLGLDGSTLRLVNVNGQLAHSKLRGWDGTLSFPEASLALSPPLLKGRFEGTFSNAAPFIGLMEEKGHLHHLLAPLLKAKGLKVTARLTLGERGLSVRELSAHGEGVKLEGQVDSERGDTWAALLATVAGIPVGVEVVPGKTHIHTKDARSWFESQGGKPPR